MKEEGKMAVERDIYKRGHLTARPNSKTVKEEAAAGVHSLNLGGKRDGFIYVPEGYHKDRPTSLAVMLHGSGGEPDHGLSYLWKYADDKNIILIAPASRLHTWDIIARESFDQDIIFIDKALELVFNAYAIDPAHIAIGGFSDGASYALGVGLSNGQIFTHIMAFSPGFAYTIERKGKPAIFVSHGINDSVLPINPCSRRLVPRLEHEGYQVNYQEFAGAHEIPDTIFKNGVEWFSGNGIDSISYH